MEQWTYFGLFTFIFLLFFIAKYIEKDNQQKIVFYTITTIFFLALALLAFNNYNMVYDATSATFVKYYEASETLVPYAFFGLALILAVYNGFLFMLCVGEEWTRLKKGREMRRNY